jgi:acetyl esterase
MPPRALRALGGAPIVLDGQQLNPRVQLGLKLLELSGAGSIDKMNVLDARAQIRSDATMFEGPKVALHQVQELTVCGSLRARLYVPFDLDEPSSLLVFFHGGGFVVGDLDTHDNSCRFLARQTGVRVLSVDYRLAPEHRFPAAADDALAAFRWVRSHAAELGVEPAQVAVGGDSAGGNLAAGVAQATRGREGPAFQLLFYPWLDLSAKRDSYRLFGEGFFLTEAQLAWYRAHYLGRDGNPFDPRSSPALAEDLAGTAPAYIATAGFDPLRDEGEEYASRLRGAGVRVALRRHSDLIHAFINAVGPGLVGRDALLEAAGALQVGLAR